VSASFAKSTLEEITAATRIGSRFLEALGRTKIGASSRAACSIVASFAPSRCYLGSMKRLFSANYDLAHGAQGCSRSPSTRTSLSSSKWIAFLLFVVCSFSFSCGRPRRHLLLAAYDARRAQTPIP